jgi:hypothetical protein
LINRPFCPDNGSWALLVRFGTIFMQTLHVSLSGALLYRSGGL